MILLSAILLSPMETTFIPYDKSLCKLLKNHFFFFFYVMLLSAEKTPPYLFIVSFFSFFHDLFKNVEKINQEYNLNFFIVHDNLNFFIDESNISWLTMNEVLQISSLLNSFFPKCDSRMSWRPGRLEIQLERTGQYQSDCLPRDCVICYSMRIASLCYVKNFLCSCD